MVFMCGYFMIYLVVSASHCFVSFPLFEFGCYLAIFVSCVGYFCAHYQMCLNVVNFPGMFVWFSI